LSPPLREYGLRVGLETFMAVMFQVEVFWVFKNRVLRRIFECKEGT
jgi:hypothetical protein